jgi:hypothetical protein
MHLLLVCQVGFLLHKKACCMCHTLLCHFYKRSHQLEDLFRSMILKAKVVVGICRPVLSEKSGLSPKEFLITFITIFPSFQQPGLVLPKASETV